MPIIRPLAIFDKTDIIRISKEIGTYAISIRPYEDCCTIFDPKNPVTQPKGEIIDRIERSFDYAALIEECVRERKVIRVDENYVPEEENFEKYL